MPPPQLFAPLDGYGLENPQAGANHKGFWAAFGQNAAMRLWKGSPQCDGISPCFANAAADGAGCSLRATMAMQRLYVSLP